MNTITEKHTEKKQAFTMSVNHGLQVEKKSKKQYMQFADANGCDLGPEILDAHIIALMGNILS
jgi:hypothetical protein